MLRENIDPVSSNHTYDVEFSILEVLIFISKDTASRFDVPISQDLDLPGSPEGHMHDQHDGVESYEFSCVPLNCTKEEKKLEVLFEISSKYKV